MAIPIPIITQAQLEERFSAKQVRRASNDDGSNSPNVTVINSALTEGSKQAIAILRSNLSDAEIENLATDEVVQGAVARLAMAILAERKPEWSREGQGPYANLAKRAKDALNEVAQARQKPLAQAQPNPLTQGHLRPTAPDFVFAPTPTRPKRGGY